ncbi:Fic family protein [Clostridium sp. L2-50]|jgi:hypothetical protein|uniref:Fic family protein n=1 Tax=Clostridium sp. L2-50 TaxID=411489 RepID=UPI00015BD4D2|nr:Fic family protein [Clostridium sp. L2-50]EDO59246.1 Fic family protein [Clostridium sp. L2-50]UEA75655.1 Fic family protein [Lachnospiraceae bacterium GAM79]UEA76389.1 Fic family protein [Lachnospiraceae bacterium GAM79]
MKNLNIFNSDDIQICSKLRNALNDEFTMQYKNGIYGYIQRRMTYSSNHIEGSTLTEDQTSLIFDTKTLDANGFVVRMKDVEEAQGHFLAFNHLIKTIDGALTEDIIKAFHYCLKAGVFEDRLNGYAIGEYKKRANIVGDTETVFPKDVPIIMKNLLEEYSKGKIDLRALAIFHAKFEKIHPFQDGNGRVGRLILFREALHNDICPFIISETARIEYVNAIKMAQSGDETQLLALFQREQDKFRDKLSYFFDNNLE